MKTELTFATRMLITMAHLSGRLEQWACRTLHEMGVGATYSMGSEALDHRCRINPVNVEPSLDLWPELLKIINRRTWRTLPEFVKNCESFYKPNCGRSSAA